MSYKIAAASSDGKVINQHFGKATQFLIFEVKEGKYSFLERMETKPFCSGGGHDDNSLLAAADALIGCRAVLVSQIGNGAAQLLESKGIQSFDINGLIEEALPKLINYYLKTDGGK
ncbi:NifB/NifX family molybdenum-iron cluster-binding protein [Clostridium aminobutyricum]|uniref:Dinitrogenase iron-molybdenum cofactor biosynthesis protein n=1 Tax=Clostridium aminobutyricum TaxID=33953 RepID=A0A939D657_CLOAM|nr:NifB/NifX family molybdenum-iron cluster-binding protein [Clostridium aminobutyricum]MBN7772239.1 dinitrogenase iron-molybdenum cofactor biosynthesis protein [Clostridium aminobutyricum]